MSKAFGTDFVLVSSVLQTLDAFENGPWIHIATVVRGFKEYMAFKHATANTVYVEEIDSKDPDLLIKIKDEQEWNDIVAFLIDQGVLSISIDHEIKMAKNMLFPNV